MERNDVEYVGVNTLRVGGYLIIEKRPCEIIQLTTAKTGKHGSAKAHIVAKDMFTGKKTDIILSTSDKIAVPIVRRNTYIVLGMDNEYVSLMDSMGKTVEDVRIPNDDIGKKLQEMFASGKTMSVSVMTALDESKIVSCSESKD
jgi:translation initiation factor 5A